MVTDAARNVRNSAGSCW